MLATPGPPRPGCWRRSPRRPPRSWPRSSTPRWRRHAGAGAGARRSATPPGSWSRRWTAGGSRRRRTPSPSGAGSARRAGPARYLRASLGRHREEASLQALRRGARRAVVADLAARDRAQARPVDAHVQRWGGALPQYAVGHLDRVARIRAAVAAVPGLAVCGAAYDGVGHPGRDRLGAAGGRPLRGDRRAVAQAPNTRA